MQWLLCSGNRVYRRIYLQNHNSINCILVQVFKTQFHWGNLWSYSWFLWRIKIEAWPRGKNPEGNVQKRRKISKKISWNKKKFWRKYFKENKKTQWRKWYLEEKSLKVLRYIPLLCRHYVTLTCVPSLRNADVYSVLS